VLVSYGYSHGEPVAAVSTDNGVVDRLDQLSGLMVPAFVVVEAVSSMRVQSQPRPVAQ
jgi:hypothetical protein